MGNSKSKTKKGATRGVRSISSVKEEAQNNRNSSNSTTLKLNLPPKEIKKCEVRDYRIVIINGYIHQLKMLLIKKYKDTEFESSVIEISQDINILMIQFYPLKQIYGIGGNLITIGENEILKSFTKLEKFEQIVYDPMKMYQGKYKHFVMDFWNEIYGHGWNQNDDLGLNYDFQSGSYRFILDFEPTAFRNYIKEIDKSHKIEILSNATCALQNSEPSILFKLDNGSIYHSVRIKSQLKFERLSKQYLNTIQIECGDNFAIFLMNNGTVFAMGNNSRGQCGISNDKTIAGMIYDPLCIDKFVDCQCFISSISVGIDSSCAIDLNNNDLWVWGDNEYNKCSETVNEMEKIKIPMLSNISYDYDIIKAKMGSLFTVCVTLEKEIILLGLLKVQIEDGSLNNIKVKDLSVGSDQVIILDQDDNIWTFGSNTWFQCGSHEKGDKYNCNKPYLLKKSDQVFPGLVNSSVNRIIAAAGQTLVCFD